MSIEVLYLPPKIYTPALTSQVLWPAACKIDRPILSNLYHRPTSNPGTRVPGFEGRQTRKPGFEKYPPGLHSLVVTGPRDNGFPGPAVTLDGPGQNHATSINHGPKLTWSMHLAPTDVSVRVRQTVIQPLRMIASVTLASFLSCADQHIANTTCYFRLRQLGKVGKGLSQDTCSQLCYE